MPSLDVGKDVVCEWIRNNFKPDAQIFDVGCCDGKWKYLLPEYPNMDGIDAWEPNCIHCQRMYRKTFHKNIAEFEYGNNWERIEYICGRLAGEDSIWYATNIEIYEYTKAYESLVWSAEGDMVYNPTLIDIWFDFDGKLFEVKSGQTLTLC